MDVHKLLFGEGAETYLPFALSRLAAFEAIDKDGFFSQTFLIDDARINVQQKGELKYITIWIGGGFYFEFATSGFPVGHRAEAGFGEIYQPLIIASDVTVDRGSIVLKPYVRGQVRVTADNNTSQVGFPQQVQLISEPVDYPQEIAGERRNFKYPYVTYEAYPTHSHTGVGMRSTQLTPFAFSFLAHISSYSTFVDRDIEIDMPWGRGFKFDPIKLAFIIAGADWSRSSGRQMVTHEIYGSREFAVMVDASNKVWVFPTGAIEAVNGSTQNVPVQYVKEAAIELPSWAYVPTLQQKVFWDTYGNLEAWLVDQPEYKWKVNVAGTKAVAVVYERSPFENDAAYWADSPDADTPWDSSDFDNLLDRLWHPTESQLSYRGGASAYNPERFFSAPGVVEALIEIQLTGGELDQFTVTVTTREVRDPGVTSYCTVAAGYSMIDVAAQGVVTDDLILLDIERHARVTRDANTPVTLWSVKNETQGTEAFCTRAYPLLAFDLSTLSLAQKISYDELNISRSVPKMIGGSWDVDFWVEHFGVWVIHSGVSKGVIYPDTMEETHREVLAALAVIDGREYLVAQEAAQSGLQLVTLAEAKDSWADSIINNFREYWSYQRHYWYSDPWALDDPDIFFHGATYPDQGWVRYREPDGGYVPPSGDVELGASYLASFWRPDNGTSEHLMFCDNPRWGWHTYTGVVRAFFAVNIWTTFFTHPNGSYAFWSNNLIYNAFGVPNGGESASDGLRWQTSNTLAVFEVDKLEHCIFDRIHFEVRKATGVAAQLDTTFLDMYNTAVQAGLDAGTLEAGISTMEKSNQQGVFEATTVLDPDVLGEDVQILDLKFTWNTKEWYYPEFAYRGVYPGGLPALVFPPLVSGNMARLSLDLLWNQVPYDATAIDTFPPIYVDLADVTSWPIRFANPLMITA